VIFRTPFVIRRKVAGTYVNGLWVEGGFTNITILASVQPLNGEQLEMLPEGRRTTQSVKIYTDTKLQTVTSANPDILLAFGDEFEVITVEPWQSNVISHYKCIAQKLGG